MNGVKELWAIVGPFVGVFVGAYIASRNQKRQWIGDCKKEEYRELLAVMSSSLSSYLSAHASLIPIGPERNKALTTALVSVFETIQSRIFIEPVMDKLCVFNRWSKITDAFDDEARRHTFAASVGQLMKEIREAARNDIGV